MFLNYVSMPMCWTWAHLGAGTDCHLQSGREGRVHQIFPPALLHLGSRGRLEVVSIGGEHKIRFEGTGGERRGEGEHQEITGFGVEIKC